MARVDRLWWTTTRSTMLMTSSGGMMVSALSVTLAMPMSRSSGRSIPTWRISQPRVNGLSASACAVLRRTSTASPVQTWLKRSSSTATGSPPSGSRIQAMLRSASMPTRTPAPPSLNSSTTGAAWPAGPETRNSWRHFSRRARALSPPSLAQLTRAAGDGTCSPSAARKSCRSRSTPWWRAAAMTAVSRMSAALPPAGPAPIVWELIVPGASGTADTAGASEAPSEWPVLDGFNGIPLLRCAPWSNTLGAGPRAIRT